MADVRLRHMHTDQLPGVLEYQQAGQRGAGVNQLVIRTLAEYRRWLTFRTPARLIGLHDLVIDRPVVHFSGDVDDNQGAGLILEQCTNVQIIAPNVCCVGSASPMVGGRGYGIVVNACTGVVIRGGGTFENCHSAVMTTDGAQRVQIGDTDSDIVTRNCWMVDVHGGACHDVRFYRITGDARVHVGNITPSLMASGHSGCVVHACRVPAIEVAGRALDCKAYGNTADEYRLYPHQGSPFDVRLEDCGDAAVITKMLAVTE
jgi:hypothetical protein